MCTTGWPEDSRRGEWYVEKVLGERRGKEMEGRRLKREIFFLRNIEGELNLLWKCMHNYVTYYTDISVSCESY